MDDELLSIVREQHRDMREMAKEVASLSVEVAKHDVQLKDRHEIIKFGRASIAGLETRMTAVEASKVNPKILLGGISAVVLVLIVAMYLIAGGSPEGVKDLVP